MSRPIGCCIFCKINLNGHDVCPFECEKKVQDEVSKVKISDYYRSESIHCIIDQVLNDKNKDNWKYDKCNFCQKKSRVYMTIDDIVYEFCSSNLWLLRWEESTLERLKIVLNKN